jgi:hypothetical protein
VPVPMLIELRMHVRRGFAPVIAPARHAKESIVSNQTPVVLLLVSNQCAIEIMRMRHPQLSAHFGGAGQYHNATDASLSSDSLPNFLC